MKNFKKEENFGFEKAKSPTRANKNEIVEGAPFANRMAEEVLYSDIYFDAVDYLPTASRARNNRRYNTALTGQEGGG